MRIDIEHFKNTLYKEAAELFPKIIEQYKHEGIYSIALYNSGTSWSYLFPTFATHKGLEKTISAYQKKEWYKDETVEELTKDLKWSPCDSPYHGLLEFYLKETTELVDDIFEAIQEMYDQECDAYEGPGEAKTPLTNALQQQLETTCLDTLIKLDADGVFAGLERDSFILNLLNGDQSYEERLERAEKVNPPSAFASYQQDLQVLIEEAQQAGEETFAMLEKLSQTEH